MPLSCPWLRNTAQLPDDFPPCAAMSSTLRAGRSDTVDNQPPFPPTQEPISSQWLVDKHYTFCLWNARSLVIKLPYFHSMLFSRKVHCFCVTETWLGETIYDAELRTSNYQIFRCDLNNKCGGVLIVVHKSIRSIQLTVEYNIEAVMVELESYLIVLCIYIQPNCSTEYFHDLLACLHS